MIPIAEQEKAFQRAKEIVSNYKVNGELINSKTKYVSSYENEDDFYHEGENKLYNKKKIIELVYSYMYNQKDNKIFQFLSSLDTVTTPKREGRYHDPLCEYAIGTSCSCWCGEKYHGMRGAKVE